MPTPNIMQPIQQHESHDVLVDIMLVLSLFLISHLSPPNFRVREQGTCEVTPLLSSYTGLPTSIPWIR